MLDKIVKRDGRKVKFNSVNIHVAALSAITSVESTRSNKECELLAHDIDLAVREKLHAKYNNSPDYPNVEEVQDLVQQELFNAGLIEEAKHFIEYRETRTAERERKTELVKTYNQMLTSKATDMNLMRENANIDGNSVMGTMLRIGSEANKSYVDKYILKPEWSYAHSNGDFHIHDKDFYELTFNCFQIPLSKLFKHGFSTGHGFLRRPNSIHTAAELAAIAIQSEQNDQFGGTSIATFEDDLAPFVATSFAKYVRDLMQTTLKTDNSFNEITKMIDELYSKYNTVLSDDVLHLIGKYLQDNYPLSSNDVDYIIKRSVEKTDHETYQGMEAFVHNMNSLHSRAGAQVPFSSINYGTNTTPEGRMIIKNVLLATRSGLGHHETPIFPVQIFRMKKGINFDEGDPNYDLFELACQTSAERLFPNFEYQDVPYNLQYYKEGKPETYLAVMGCRTRTYGNINGDSVCAGRGNFSFTTINLPRLGILAKGDWNKFYSDLDNLMDMARDQLIARFEIIANKHVYNFPFAMGQHLWNDSEDLKNSDTVRKPLMNSSLAIGFIGLAECMTAMTGKHHGEDAEVYNLAYDVIKHMRARTDMYEKETGFNFGTFSTPAEGLSFRFLRIDRKRFGKIEGVTDKEYYTNSFHIPVSYHITAAKKMQLEGKFHELCNGGCITYVELDGDPTKNIKAFENLVKYANDCGINYFAINHPVDRCPVCGYTGIIGDECPKCGFKDGMTEMSLDKIVQCCSDMPDFEIVKDQ